LKYIAFPDYAFPQIFCASIAALVIAMNSTPYYFHRLDLLINQISDNINVTTKKRLNEEVSHET